MDDVIVSVDNNRGRGKPLQKLKVHLGLGERISCAHGSRIREGLPSPWPGKLASSTDKGAVTAQARLKVVRTVSLDEEAIRFRHIDPYRLRIKAVILNSLEFNMIAT